MNNLLLDAKNCMVNLKNVFLPVFEAIQVLEEVGNAACFVDHAAF